MKKSEYKIKLIELVAGPEKSKTSPDFIFRLRLSDVTDPCWDECFEEACKEIKADPIQASIVGNEVQVECGVASFEDNYFKRIKAAVEFANEEAERRGAEKEQDRKRKKQKEQEDQNRLVGLKDRLNFD